MSNLKILLRNYPQIYKWFGPWLQQLRKVGGPEDYRVILNELERVRSGSVQEEPEENLVRLERHLETSSKVCKDFNCLFQEKSELGDDVRIANATIFDKLAEIRAIFGLDRLSFKNIEFIKNPDIFAIFGYRKFLVEVTRLGFSPGKRRNVVWDGDTTENSGVRVRHMHKDGRFVKTFPEVIYHKVVEKYKQLKNSQREADKWMVWISSGRDYLTVSDYSLEYTEPVSVMPDTKLALEHAMRQIKDDRLCAGLSHIVLSLGRDDPDLVSPELSETATA